MTQRTAKYTVGNIVAIIVAMFMGIGMALYAIFGDDTGRIGRSPLTYAVLGVVSAVYCGRHVIRGIQSRRQ